MSEASLVAHITCYGQDDGIAFAIGTGGTTPYTFNWTPGGQTGDTAYGLTPGVHTATLTDARGCTSSDTVTIVEPPQLVVEIDTSLTIHPYCTGVSSASLTAVASGGTPNYSYEWDDNLIIPQTTATAVALAAGIYTITVTDSRNCIATDNNLDGNGLDCSGICGGNAQLDECGICNGPGAELVCSDGSYVCNEFECPEEEN